MKKYFFILCTLIMTFLAGCTPPAAAPEASQTAQENAYFPQTCHYAEKDLKCVTVDTSDPIACTLNIEPSDFCARFVSCSNEGDLIKETDYDACVDCFSTRETPSDSCLEQFPEFKNFP